MELKSYKHLFPTLADGSVHYFDHAATTQMPSVVIEAMKKGLDEGRANPWRGLYPWAEEATESLEESRRVVVSFFGAQPEQTIFTSGATEGLNMVAFGVEHLLLAGDVIVVTQAEHHSNLLPWREVARRTHAEVDIVPVGIDGRLDEAAFDAALRRAPKIVAMTHVSNVTGAAFDVFDLTKRAKSAGAFVVIDAAQSAAHLRIDFSSLGADALAVSAHKLYGPMGIGALLLSDRLSDVLWPAKWGGGMVDRVGTNDFVLTPVPRRFEAGTRNVLGAKGFAQALKWLQELGWPGVEALERRLMLKLDTGLRALPGVTVYGPTAEARFGVTSLSIAGRHSHDLAEALGERGICVRAGLHCASLMTSSLDPRGTLRISLGLGNDESDVDALLAALKDLL